jgi:hypothetical protein
VMGSLTMGFLPRGSDTPQPRRAAASDDPADE